MPIMFKVQKVPSQATAEKEKEQKKARIKAKKTEIKAQRKRREAAAEAMLFGSELFEPIAKREREIVVRFPVRFTHNRTRISADGKFAYRQINDFYFELFYLVEPIKDYTDDLVLEPNEKCWLFHWLTIEELEETVRRICHAEFSDEKQKLLADIKQLEKERQEQLDKEEEELERIDEEFLDNLEREAQQQNLPVESEAPEAQVPVVSVKEEKKNLFIPTFKKVS